MKLVGTTAIVTGGAVRLGRALALALADHGVNIALHYGSSINEAEQTAQEIAKRGVGVKPIQADLREPSQAARQIVKFAVQEFGSVEILINSAAIFEEASLQQTTQDQWDRHLAINLTAPVFLAKEFAARFVTMASEDARGQIINLLDWRGTHPAGGTSHFAYTIAKSGLAAVTQALAVECGPRVQVNGIAPGAILPPPGKDAAYLERLAQNTLLDRVGNPDDIARAALYLLQSDFISGEILHINGGEHLKP